MAFASHLRNPVCLASSNLACREPGRNAGSMWAVPRIVGASRQRRPESHASGGLQHTCCLAVGFAAAVSRRHIRASAPSALGPRSEPNGEIEDRWISRGFNEFRGRRPRKILGRDEREIETWRGMKMGDFTDVLEATSEIARRGNLDPNELMREVIDSSALEDARGLQRGAGSFRDQETLKIVEESLRPEDLPSIMAHYRKSTKQRESEMREKGDDEFFFSQKTWELVPGITEDMLDLTQSLRLPRPSRIQYQSYCDIVRGCNCVIAEQAGAGKTLAFLLPLLKRHVFSSDFLAPSAVLAQGRPKILVVAPTAFLANQIADVARQVATHSGRPFQTQVQTGGMSLIDRKRDMSILRNSCDLLIATSGRLRYLLSEARDEPLGDLTALRAIVWDEVDVLLNPASNRDLSLPDLRNIILQKSGDSQKALQWVFASATVNEEAAQALRNFDLLLRLGHAEDEERKLNEKMKDYMKKRKGKELVQMPTSLEELPKPVPGLVWHRGAGLHKVSTKCEHVLVDCTPSRWKPHETGDRQRSVDQKFYALAWHLRHGILRGSSRASSRILVFCNESSTCSVLQERLAEAVDASWKVLGVSSFNDSEANSNAIDAFNGSSSASSVQDFFKKRILITTDRLSYGIDFAEQHVDWVVLFDWPRDAIEYIRRVGRTGRSGQKGGILSLVYGGYELKAGKSIMKAALQGICLQRKAFDHGDARAEIKKTGAWIERFDPQHEDWRSADAYLLPAQWIKKKRSSTADQEEGLTGRINEIDLRNGLNQAINRRHKENADAERAGMKRGKNDDEFSDMEEDYGDTDDADEDLGRFRGKLGGLRW